MDSPVIDFHSHAGSWGRYGVDADCDLYLKVMDAAGVDRTCINCIWFGDARRGNDLVMEYVKRAPDRFIGVAFATPHYPEEAVRELERAVHGLGMAYVKIYPDYFGLPNDDPAYFPIYEWVDEQEMAVMCHATYPFDPPGTTIEGRFTALSERFPNVRWVMAHTAGAVDADAAETARTLPNVYMETCSSRTTLGATEFNVERAGEDKVLYGSDMALMDARQQIAKVVTADIPRRAKEKILGLNAMRLLKLLEWLPGRPSPQGRPLQQGRASSVDATTRGERPPSSTGGQGGDAGPGGTRCCTGRGWGRSAIDGRAARGSSIAEVHGGPFTVSRFRGAERRGAWGSEGDTAVDAAGWLVKAGTLATAVPVFGRRWTQRTDPAWRRNHAA